MEVTWANAATVATEVARARNWERWGSLNLRSRNFAVAFVLERHVWPELARQDKQARVAA